MQYDPKQACDLVGLQKPLFKIWVSSLVWLKVSANELGFEALKENLAAFPYFND